jgi:hypothetical protein
MFASIAEQKEVAEAFSIARRQLSYELISLSVEHKRNNKKSPTTLHFNGFIIVVGNGLLVVEVSMVDEDEVEDWLVVP